MSFCRTVFIPFVISLCLSLVRSLFRYFSRSSLLCCSVRRSFCMSFFIYVFRVPFCRHVRFPSVYVRRSFFLSSVSLCLPFFL